MKALFATDYSHGARVARELLASLDWPRGTAFRVVTAYEPLELFVDELLADGMRELEAKLSKEAASLAGAGRVVESAALVGRPATVILDEARRLGADLVLVGSRGQGPLATTLLGSVAAEIVDHAPSPVLVARCSAVNGSSSVRTALSEQAGASAARGVGDLRRPAGARRERRARARPVLIDVLAEYWWLALLLIGGALLVAGSLAGPRGSA